MIIFYEKQTGKIIGTIDGRVHPKEHLNMWVGDKNETDRIIVNWKPVRFYNKEGKEIKDLKKEDVFSSDFEPDCEQKQVFADIDKKPISVYDYEVNLKNKKLKKLV